jgi:Family of unknown function (DUF5677)
MNLEEIAMALLRDLQAEVAEALNSLVGKLSRGLHDNYIFYSASHVNRAVDGFIFLRDGHRIDAAKLAIRPCIEAMLRIEAVRKKPELLYRIAYSERLEVQKWVRPAATRQGKKYDFDSDDKQWREFKRMYEEQFPGHKLLDKELRLIDAASGGGLKAYYDSYYRMYCKYDHAALVASGGYLDDLADPYDSRTMVCCAFSALDALVSIGAMTKNVEVLRHRTDTLSKQPTERLIRQRER